LAIKEDIKIYVQVAYLIADGKTHEREFENLLSIPNNCKKMVVSMDETAAVNYKGIDHVSVRRFLTGNF
jgi:predicted AAA+ superfamily ATPase